MRSISKGVSFRLTVVCALSVSVFLLSACGGQAIINPEQEGGAGGTAGTGGAGGATGGAGGVAGAAGTAGIGGSSATGGFAGTGGVPVDAGPWDAAPAWCFDNSGCPADKWCDFEPAAPGMCATGGKAGVCTPRPSPADCPVYDQCPGACGCDGQWFCDACQAHVSGVQVTTDSSWCKDTGSGSPCGGIAGAQCPSNEWCDFPADQVCGYVDGMGVCRSRPQGCPADCPGVCGCDGSFYCNECTANAAGVDITGGQECLNGGGSGTPCASDSQCAPSLRCCYPCGIPGCSNECMQPDANGQCPMFP